MSDNLDSKLQKGIRLQKCIAMDGDYGSEKTGSPKAAPRRSSY